jgi:type I restriction enzyme M protein
MVEIIEPQGGRVFDPACGSGGMFVQSARFIEEHRKDLKIGAADVFVYGQEKTLETVKREKAQMFITLAEPTKPTHTEAVKESFYETSYGRYSRLQIVTVEQLLTINKPTIPVIDSSGVKKAAREASATAQDALPF